MKIITTIATSCSDGYSALTKETLTHRYAMYALFRFKSNRKYRFMHLSLFALVLAIALLVGTATHAQDRTSDINKIFSWVKPDGPGCICAVSQHGKMVVNRAYGMADLERNVPLTTTSILDAASVTKQFVAAAVLLLVEEQRLSLSDDVRKYIPELPDYGHKITLDQLLTHTSGIRDWTVIFALAGGNTDALTLTLRQRGLNFNPGEEWSYSNSGYVLLKEIVARTSGISFAAFAQKRLFEPLGMKLTNYQNDLREVVKNRALAYDQENGRWKLDMALDNDRGGGGALLSTASDLLIWNEALTSGKLGAFVTQKLQEPATLNNGRKLGYARGLFLDTNRGSKVIWHTGGSRGYGTMLARFPDQGLSIAIMCNSGDAGSRSGMSRRIFDLFVPDTIGRKDENKAEAPATAATGSPAPDLNSKAGLYFNAQNGEPLRLVENKGKLSIAGGPALVMVDKDRFRNQEGSLNFMSNDEFELRFLPKEGFELKSKEGKITVYRRAQPYAPAPEDLKAFAGRFESDEIGTVFVITPKENGLEIRIGHSPDKSLEFKPVDGDTFQWGRMTVRFRRDKTGKVVAFDYTNPVVRNIRFTRLSNPISQP